MCDFDYEFRLRLSNGASAAYECSQCDASQQFKSWFHCLIPLSVMGRVILDSKRVVAKDLYWGILQYKSIR